ncbi:uncharacterized protein LOC132280848 [Cornus florida]|uniref:uncharacterized protein LOC132280848 n=1 Tax=Cornus florida TaxID=4283 RepID=UPI002897EF21|nr:uncharacterized protein LOC132280848 [Cornus florida]
MDQRNQSKHCAFHSDFSHLTNDYRSLRRQVEELVTKGELADYLVNSGRQRIQLKQAHKLQRVKEINAVKYKLSSTQISFHEGDFKRIQLPHEDPLVIGLLAANCLVSHILIDLGSNANIVMKWTFDQLKLAMDQVCPTRNPLVGFDGRRVEPIGVITLSVIAAKRSLKKNFVIVDIHLTYNLLMGQGWIHRMEGAPSTLHQVMICVSPNELEVIDIWGDQVAAKECYHITICSTDKGNQLSK